jgi:hypothetical protein
LLGKQIEAQAQQDENAEIAKLEMLLQEQASTIAKFEYEAECETQDAVESHM